MTADPPTLAEEFEAAFGSLLLGTLEMLSLDEDAPSASGGGLDDVHKAHLAAERLKANRRRAKETVDHAREELRAISRTHEQQSLLASRSAALPSAAEHAARMAASQAARLAHLKENVELEQGLYRSQAELQRLQAELREEEGDAFDVGELSGEVLRIKLYRDFGFTPIEEDGVFTKVLVRSKRTQDARTVQLSADNHDFYWSNYLWDALAL